MGQKGRLGKLYGAFEYLYKLLYLNVLWLSFTVLGGFIFGWAPSTHALFHVIRKEFKSELGTDSHIFKTYLGAFKSSFVHGNIIGIILSLIGYMLLVNYRYASLRGEFIFQFIQVVTVVVAVLFVILLTYIFPMYAHYQLKLSAYFSKSLLVGVMSPIPTLLNLAWVVIVGYLSFQLYPLSLFFIVSGLAYGLMGITYSFFVRNDQKVEEEQLKSAV